MRTTLNLDEKLIKEAMNLTKITQKTLLIHSAIRHLIEKYASEKLARLGGTLKTIKAPPRRKLK